jgi:hypothetical protein
MSLSDTTPTPSDIQSELANHKRAWREGEPIPDEHGDNWEPVGLIAQRMAMAWDHVEAEEEAHDLVAYCTDRQRAYIQRWLWELGSDEWRSWARKWLMDWHARNPL